MLEEISFGKRYFEIGILLRDSLLISSMLFNSEAWYNVTDTELNLLEKIDLQFLRKLFQAPIGTPKEMMYLELGCIPFREIIRERRLGFLHYIVNENENSMIYKIFQCQNILRTSKDWVTTVTEDLKYLDLDNLCFDEIKNMKKAHFMNKVKSEIKIRLFEKLQNIKLSHSKVNKIKHNGLRIQKYLKPNKSKMSKEEAQLIFKLRCRVTETKNNLKRKYTTLECRACGLEEETQEHIMVCKELNEKKEIEEFEYEKLLHGTVIKQLQIARKFKRNMDILERKIKNDQ